MNNISSSGTLQYCQSWASLTFNVEHQKSTEPELHSVAAPASKMMRLRFCSTDFDVTLKCWYKFAFFIGKN
jgi:hypothetical protein